MMPVPPFAFQIASVIAALIIPSHVHAQPAAVPVVRHHAVLVTRTIADSIVFTGKVTDRNTGKAISGAIVMVAGTTFGAVTDTSGSYRFAAIPPVSGSSVSLSTRRIGYQSVNRAVVVESDTVHTGFSMLAAATTCTLGPNSQPRKGR